MRQAITTKFLGPTNNRGARVKAIARKADSVGGEMSATVDFSYSGTDVDHCRAAKACAEKYAWSGLWVAGGNVDGTGNVYVNVGNTVSPGVFMWMNEGVDWFYVAPLALHVFDGAGAKRCGPYATRAAADSALAMLKADGKPDAASLYIA